MIEFTIADGIAEVVLNAPGKLNSLDNQALTDLGHAYDEAERADVRALWLRAEGRVFCAGRDIVSLDVDHDDPDAFLSQLVTPLFKKMASLPAPTFASVQGACLGLGLGLAIATDIVYIADDAKVGSPFGAIGGALDSGGHSLFVERLGYHRAMDLIVTGDFLTGAEAVAAGLFSRSVSGEELASFTRDKVQVAAQGPTKALVACKEIAAKIREDRLGLWEAVSLENRAQGELAATRDYREGLQAFREKRQPTFVGE